jgi:DNA adenine methylase
MIIKNTDFIYELYNKKEYFINSFIKQYSANIKNRNNRDVKHLIITNYELLSLNL